MDQQSANHVAAGGVGGGNRNRHRPIAIGNESHAQRQHNDKEPTAMTMWSSRGMMVLMAIAACGVGSSRAIADDPWIEFAGNSGPGMGKRIVLVGGDEEYRSEESLPQLAKILSKHHGFHCTVLFAIDPKTGEINPNQSDNIPGLASLAKANLMIIATRFRNLPDDQMQHLADYIESGKPMIGLRTATHAFNNPGSAKFGKYHWKSQVDGYTDGFGRQVLGETWISHHGNHGSESTRGVIAKGQESHPIVRGIHAGEIWGPSDVYGVRLPLPGDSQPIVLGAVVAGMKPDDPVVEGEKNSPMMPVAWTKTYRTSTGKTARVFTTTMGAATDLIAVGTRRMIINASFWALGMETQITPDLNVQLVGDYRPTPFSFNGFVKGKKPQDYLAD
jgi:type 1 glutamine amidotransferase